MKVGLYYARKDSGELLRYDQPTNLGYRFTNKRGETVDMTVLQAREQLFQRAVDNPVRLQAFAAGRDYPAGEVVRVSEDELRRIVERGTPDGRFYHHAPYGNYIGVRTEGGTATCRECLTLEECKLWLRKRG